MPGTDGPNPLRLPRAIELAGALLFALLATAPSALAATDCRAAQSDPNKLGVTRILEIDTSSGPILGKMTRLAHEPQFLQPGEVVLTFDDGPVPWITRAILDTLDQHCTRATFFNIGKMAIAYPQVVREVLARGHTLGTHTWSHPLDLRNLSPEGAIAEMEQGFAAVAAAAGQPIAPFFRFPGLSDAPGMMEHLRSRQVASVTVDVVTNDSYLKDEQRLINETLAKVDANRGGIVLFHDIKPTTARALPVILRALSERGYAIVHLVPKRALSPRHDLVDQYDHQVRRQLATSTRNQTAAIIPFLGAAHSDAAEHATISSEPMSGRDTAREDSKLDERELAAGSEDYLPPPPAQTWVATSSIDNAPRAAQTTPRTKSRNARR